MPRVTAVESRGLCFSEHSRDLPEIGQCRDKHEHWNSDPRLEKSSKQPWEIYSMLLFIVAQVIHKFSCGKPSGIAGSKGHMVSFS